MLFGATRSFRCCRMTKPCARSSSKATCSNMVALRPYPSTWGPFRLIASTPWSPRMTPATFPMSRRRCSDGPTWRRPPSSASWRPETRQRSTACNRCSMPWAKRPIASAPSHGTPTSPRSPEISWLPVRSRRPRRQPRCCANIECPRPTCSMSSSPRYLTCRSIKAMAARSAIGNMCRPASISCWA